MEQCPCGLQKTYANCCGQFINGIAIANTPDELMRSRYTAFTQANVEYIQQTMCSPALDDFQPEEAREWAKAIEWKKLEVKHSTIKNDRGFVEFIAHLTLHNKPTTIHEVSEFKKENGKWFYIKDISPTVETFVNKNKIGRNDVCSCGSGKKYKKCCMTKT